MDNISEMQISSKNTEDSCKDAEMKSKKITLTSRTLENKMGRDKESFEEVSLFVDEFEKFVMNGFSDLRKVLHDLKNGYAAKEENYSKQISTLVESNNRTEILEGRNHRLEEDLNEVKSRMKETIRENQDMIHKLAKLDSKHTDYLEVVATKHREKKIAKKVIDKWRYNLDRRSKINLLKDENKYLKKELHKCQSDAKKAFLRSVHTLNNEALSMFETTSNRRLSRKTPIEGSNAHDESGSVASSTSVTEVWSDKSQGSVNSAESRSDDGKYLGREKRHQSESSNRRNREQNKENFHFGSAEDVRSEESKRYAKFKNTCRSAADGLKQKEKTEAMKYIRKNASFELPSSVVEAQNACHARSNLHTCRCQPLSARSEKCPKCPIKSLNFAHMPPTRMASAKQRNIAIATIRDKEKANVMYNPTGTAVVIEKHLSY